MTTILGMAGDSEGAPGLHFAGINTWLLAR